MGRKGARRGPPRWPPCRRPTATPSARGRFFEAPSTVPRGSCGASAGPVGQEHEKTVSNTEGTQRARTRKKDALSTARSTSRRPHHHRCPSPNGGLVRLAVCEREPLEGSTPVADEKKRKVRHGYSQQRSAKKTRDERNVQARRLAPKEQGRRTIGVSSSDLKVVEVLMQEKEGKEERTRQASGCGKDSEGPELVASIRSYPGASRCESSGEAPGGGLGSWGT